MNTMTAEQSALWRRIEAYSFDAPGATRTFAARLVEKQGWTLPFAQRAIEEYRRFTFLAKASSHFVSPSKVVDEVWHQHLLYTQSYWNDFCPNVLNRPLHHFPANGVPGEAAMHVDWYLRTLESYSQYFGWPPVNIWPSGKASQEPDDSRPETITEHARVSPTRRFWRNCSWAAALILLVLLAGCAGGPVLWPLNLKGPDFLSLFAGLLGALILLTIAVSVLIRCAEYSHDDPRDELDDNEIAYLSGKTPRLVGMIATRLSRDGHLEVAGDSGLLVQKTPLPLDTHPLDQEVVSLLNQGRSLYQISRQIKPDVEPIRQRLAGLGLLVSDASNGWSRVILCVLSLSLVVLGIAKLVVGLQLNKPIGFLIALLFTAVLLLVIACQAAHRSYWGSEILSRLTNEHSKLKKYGTELVGGQRLPLALALFGPAVLYQTEYERLRKVIVPGQANSSSGCSSGAEACGGGAGCGGGGCGGGGCGGCGGG
jgi:uncharacterized protein (TIGR04222 family)